MTITDSSREKISWLLVESLLIVVSILLAFWIDTWWNERQLRADEEQILASLLEDLHEKRAHVDTRYEYMSAIAASTRELLYASTDVGTDLSRSSVDRLLGDIWWSTQASVWSAPLLDSIVSGGDLNLIENRQLRKDLVEWSERFNRLEESVERDIRFYDDRIMPFMESNVDMRQVVNVIEHAPGDPDFKVEFGKKFKVESPRDHTNLLMNQEFQGLLLRRSVLLGQLSGRLGSFGPELDELIATIEGELAN